MREIAVLRSDGWCVNEAELKKLLSARAVTQMRIARTTGSRYRLYVLLNGRTKEDVLITSRHEPREWVNLTTLASYLTSRSPFMLPVLLCLQSTVNTTDRNRASRVVLDPGAP